MPNSTKTTATQRLAAIREFAASLNGEFAKLRKNDAGTTLDSFFSDTNRFDETVCCLFENLLHRQAPNFDYTPKVKHPSLDEIQSRLANLNAHISATEAESLVSTEPWLYGLCRLSSYLLSAVDWLVSELAPDDSGAVMTKPNFAHRLSPLGNIGSTLALSDTVAMMANKADAVLTMLGNHFAKDDDEDRPSDEAIYYALQSARDELADIGAVVSAFHNANKAESSND